MIASIASQSSIKLPSNSSNIVIYNFFIKLHLKALHPQFAAKMPIPPYSYTGPIDHTTPIDHAQLKGKSIIITGGANGMGETCVRHFASSGAHVTIADTHPRGQALSDELNQQHGAKSTVFVQVDIRDWEQQKRMFDTALQTFGAIDVVIANAGISRASGDSLWTLDDPAGEPTKPDLNIVEVNLKGSFYTWKLAVHYWRRQKEEEGRDRCFIMTGSMVAWIDSPVGSASLHLSLMITCWVL